jgi:hypothetical protein
LVVARVDVNKVAEREALSGYPFSPLARNFLSFVNITALVIKSTKILKKIWFRRLVREDTEEEASKFSILSYYSDKMCKLPPASMVNDVERNNALEFIFRTESKLVKKFIPQKE